MKLWSNLQASILMIKVIVFIGPSDIMHFNVMVPKRSGNTKAF